MQQLTMSSSSIQSHKTSRYEVECQLLHDYYKGNGGISRHKIVEIFSKTNSQELKAIQQTYKALYGHEFLSIISGNQKCNPFDRIVYLRLQDAQSRDAEILRYSLLKSDINLNAVLEIACTRSSMELYYIKLHYQSQYHSDLEQDIAMKIKGGFKETLLAISKSCRNYTHKADAGMALCDAKTLYEAVETAKTIDQKTIISLLSRRNTDQVKAMLSSFKQLYGHEFSRLVKQGKCGQFGRELRIVIRCIQSPEKFFAKRLRMKNADAREVLIRTVVTRAGIDIKAINKAFAAKTASSLESLVRKEFKNGRDKAGEAVADLLLHLIKC